jgi:hypothetical protein
MDQKSILEQALLQIENLEEAVKANAKGILASTMKQELNDLLKESMEEEEEVTPEEEENDVPMEVGDEDALDNEDESSEEDELSKDIDSMDSDEETHDEEEMDGEEEDVVDMTDADDEEVLKIFKAMNPEDGIIVKKDEDQIEMADGDDEYIIKLDEEVSDEEVAEEESEIEVSEEEMEDEEMSEEVSDEEVVYEIELDDEELSEEGMEDEVEVSEEEEVEVSEEEFDEPAEEEVDEAARTTWNAHGGERTGIKGKKIFKAGASINEEVETLKKQNDEYKKALVLFKEKLNEVAVFNANLAYATRLFTEHSTTKQEKLNILKRFDSISTLKESKSLYTTIKTELDTKKPISESVVEKITTAPTSSSSSEVLSESKAYENPQFKRMKDLMSKMK